ncbi:DNA primase family protein, partial [Paenibacillus sp. YK5]
FPHDPKYFMKNQLPVRWNPEADRRLAANFIHSVVPTDTVPLIEEWLGYLLIPTVKYQKMLLIKGSGKNGKSKFLNYCRELLGDANVSYVELKEFEENRFKAAQLKDKIANIYADISFKRLASTHMIKNLVAGDEISAEEKGERAFPLRSYAKLMFSANDLPASSDTTDGFFRRFFIVPFDKKFTKDNEDVELDTKLGSTPYLESLLVLAVDGLRRLEANKRFSESESVRKEMEIFEYENKPIVQFLEDECILHDNREDRTNSVSKEKLFTAYRNWCERTGRSIMNTTNFFKQLYRETEITREKHEFQPRINGKQIRYISGITLQEEEEGENPFDL